MATIKKSRKRKRPSQPTVDTPIVVGGGGGTKTKGPKYVELDFDHDFFQRVPGTRQYRSDNDSLRRLKINGRSKNVRNSTWIKVFCEKRNESVGDITIYLNPLGLEFYSGSEDFPASGRRTHRGDRWEITGVYANGVGDLYRYQSGNTDCTIEINTPARPAPKRSQRKTASKKGSSKKR